MMFPNFQTFHSDLVKGRPMSDEGIELLKANTSEKQRLPEYLDFVAEVGLCNVQNGLIWLVDPVEYVDTLELFLGENQGAAFARTSFGGLFFVNEERVFTLPCIYDWFTGFGRAIDLVFESALVESKTLENSLWKKQHQLTTERLGQLKENEVFGFEPAIALGGNEDNLESIKKFEIHSHLTLLSQLVSVQRR
jgi:hypothetical protein